MTLVGSMTIRIYDSEIREVCHDLGYWIINQTYWYPDNKYTEETAKKAFLNRKNNFIQSLPGNAGRKREGYDNL